MGIVNFYAVFGYSVDIWVTFKLFELMELMPVFIVLQVIMLGKYMKTMNLSASENTYAAQCVITDGRVEAQKAGDR